MSRIEKSDAQLDAEAVGSTHLESRIALHRALNQDDLHISKMVSTQPPTSRDPQTGIVHQHDATQVGMNMSARLYRFVSEAHGYSEAPWRSAFVRLRQWCRRHHEFHTGPKVPYWRGSLCQEAVRLVVIGPEQRVTWLPSGPLNLVQAARVLRYDHLTPVLTDAFDYIEESIDYARARAERRSREDAGHGPGAVPAPVHRHEPLDGLHRLECPQCRRNAA